MSRYRLSSKTCPSCNQSLARVRRSEVERQLSDPATGWPLARYRCGNLACGWQGLLPRRPGQRPRRLEPRVATGWVRTLVAADLPWARAGSVVLVMALLVLLGVQGSRHLLGAPPVQLSSQVPLGESHDGDRLPARHPWVRPVLLTAADGAGAGPAVAAAAVPAAMAPIPVAPLDMRRGCAWGQPGRNPYRGTVEQALLHARLPNEVVAEIGRKVRAREASDRLEIRTGSIQGVKQGQAFDPQQMAMSFGRTLCLNTRVNFAPGHVEGADLYEARDARGHRHAVMVPDVCGNVTVLGERGERRRALQAAGGADEDWWLLATAAAMADEASVPEPGSLAAALAALLALAGVSARRRRR